VAYQESLALFRKLDLHGGVAMALHNLGHSPLRQGDGSGAAACFREGLALSHADDNRLGCTNCLAGLAGVAAAARRPERAATLLGAAAALLGAGGLQMEPADQADYDRYATATRAILGEAPFAAAQAAGRAMPLEQVVAYGLEEDADLPGRQ
jgi:hypothetical protein